MTREQLIQLTNDVYCLTALFPKKEPLRYKVREAGNDILASFVRSQPKSISENLTVLQGFLEIAKNQNWVSPNHILNIQTEYSKLEGELKAVQNNPENEKAPIPSVILPSFSRQNLDKEELSSSFVPVKASASEQDNRQKKIIDFLKEKGKAQVWQLKQVFPQVSKRTLRRDFEYLLKEGMVERIGERNGTYYQVKIV